MPTPTKNIQVKDTIEYDNESIVVVIDAITDVKSLVVLDWVSNRDYTTILSVERLKSQSENYSYRGSEIRVQFSRKLEAKVFIMIFDPEFNDVHEMTLNDI